MASHEPFREFARFHRPAEFPGLELLAARYYAQEFAPHIHEGYVIALVEAGVERFHCRGGEHYVPAGHIAFVNPGEVHTGKRGADEGWRYRVFYPDLASIRRICESMGGWSGGTPYFPATVVEDHALTKPLRDLHRSLSEDAGRLERESCWYAVMGLMLSRHARGLTKPRIFAQARHEVVRAREILQERYADNLGLETLAAEVGLSPWHLNRVFRESMGLAPHAYQNQLRLTRAKVLLTAHQSLVEVAAQVGYADQAHFSRQFKRAFGVTPGQYKLAC